MYTSYTCNDAMYIYTILYTYILCETYIVSIFAYIYTHMCGEVAYTRTSEAFIQKYMQCVYIYTHAYHVQFAADASNFYNQYI